MITIGIYLHSDPTRLHATLESLARHTPEARIILLPDAPEPVMQATLATLRHYPQLASAESCGQAAAFNRLITLDDAPLVVFLESGVLVTAQWLERMRAALEAQPQVGLAGPSTNCAWNAQCQREAPGFLASPEQIDVYAAHLASRYSDRTAMLAPLYSLGDFCYVVKREVIAAIGGADEGYGLGPCWEMDYNIRAARAGFQGVWVCGAYVHRMPIPARRVQQEAHLLEANKRRYQAKFCRLQLEHKRREYCKHCEGDTCEYFAPPELIQIRLPLVEGSIQTSNIPPSTQCSQQPEPRPPSSNAPYRNTIARMAHLPLVSCIMPTHNRRPFVAQAIGYFLRQDYPNRELIIVDDGKDPVADLVPDDPRIRYLHQEHNSMLGAKRNLACQEARGEIIAHWDDDDWMASWRLRYQVETLLQERADICGLDRLFFYDPASQQAWQYVYPKGGRPWLAGGTLCYTKACWRGNPFPHVNVGEDARFVWGTHAQKLVVLRNSSFYVAVVHPGNTSPKRTQGAWWHAFPSAEIHDLLGEDWAFYAAPLPEQGTPARGGEAAGSVPLVSCIMPTYNRRAFVPHAIRYFLRQDYPNKELILIDDGTEPVSDLLPDDPQVRYLRVNHKQTLGAKRNLAVQAALGEFIVHWDDDDWYAPRRLTAQLHKLRQNAADVVALRMPYVLALASMEFWRCQPELHARLHYMDLCPGTIAYRRQLWERYGPYPEAPLAWGEDVVFLNALPHPATRICRLEDEELFVCVRHGHNTWRMAHDWSRTPQGWRNIPRPHFLPLEDYQGYVELVQAAAQPRLQPAVV